MTKKTGQREDHTRSDPREGVSVEPDFDYSWLSKEPPGYEDVDDDGQVVESGDCQPSSDGR